MLCVPPCVMMQFVTLLINTQVANACCQQIAASHSYAVLAVASCNWSTTALETWGLREHCDFFKRDGNMMISKYSMLLP